ncbi:uncharacterized protein C3orf38-like [Heterodontus francisci]|uniref:uncharacterized protein C3orf38-like n=1 Tax=Heterodontus francisci TaxID=7792 RepID=UPI00355C108F
MAGAVSFGILLPGSGVTAGRSGTSVRVPADSGAVVLRGLGAHRDREVSVMSMLSEKERCGCREILLCLGQSELLSVADTVTNRMLKIENGAGGWWLPGPGPQPPTNNSSESSSGNDVPQKDIAADFKNDYHSMGLEFCKWFYRLLNSQNPLLEEQSKEWGPQHFWEDVILKFSYRTSEQHMEVYTGAIMVSLRLLALTKDEHLFLNPNLTGGGLKCIHSPHGLVIIAVAGTIHRESVCLGIFEQIFGLIRCPSSENNWKMKFVHLKITGHGTAVPATVQSNEASQPPIIKYESNELLQVFEEHTVGVCD